MALVKEEIPVLKNFNTLHFIPSPLMYRPPCKMGNQNLCSLHRWARYFKKVAERALALYKAFKAIAALKNKKKTLKRYTYRYMARAPSSPQSGVISIYGEYLARIPAPPPVTS